MALSWDALTTVEAMRAYVEREKTATLSGRFADEWMERVINATSAAIATYCQRQLIAPATAITYTLTGDGGSLLLLPEYPVVSITSVKNLASAETIPARTTFGGTGYSLSDADTLAGMIRLHGYVTDSDSAAVEVKARLGYDATTAGSLTPTRVTREHRVALDQIESACLQWAALLFSMPIPSAETVQMDQVAYTIREQSIPTRVRQLLEPYRRYAL